MSELAKQYDFPDPNFLDETSVITEDNENSSTQYEKKILPISNLEQLKHTELDNSTSEKPSDEQASIDSRYRDLPDVPRVVVPPRHAPPSTRYIPLQEWEGVVTGVDGDDFEATLADRTDPTNPSEQAEFSRDDLAWDEDMQLVTPGAIFDMSVGYEIRMIGYCPGQRQKVCRLRFRRIPGWSKRDIEKIERKAAEFESAFGNDQNVNDA